MRDDQRQVLFFFFFPCGRGQFRLENIRMVFGGSGDVMHDTIPEGRGRGDGRKEWGDVLW